MSTIIINIESDKEEKLVQTFLQKHKIKGRILSDEDKEDLVLAKLMEETDNKDIIDTNSFLEKLLN